MSSSTSSTLPTPPTTATTTTTTTTTAAAAEPLPQQLNDDNSAPLLELGSEAESRLVQALSLAAVGGLFDTANTQNGQSELGTFKHWKDEYTRDYLRFQSETHRPQSGGEGDNDVSEDEDNHSDGDCSVDSDGGTGDSGKRAMGQIWYGRSVASKQAKIVAPFCFAQGTSLPTVVVDVGTGNGELLCRLASMSKEAQQTPASTNGGAAEANSTTLFIGTDYCLEAALLAQAVAKNHPSGACNAVEFMVDDIFRTALQPSSVDVLLDKGTLDALSCMYDDSRGTERVIAYARALGRLGRVGKTVLCVTSGNFSLDELGDALQYGGWTYESHVTDYPTFQFMGVTGTHVRTVLFRLTVDPVDITPATLPGLE